MRSAIGLFVRDDEIVVGRATADAASLLFRVPRSAGVASAVERALADAPESVVAVVTAQLSDNDRALLSTVGAVEISERTALAHGGGAPEGDAVAVGAAVWALLPDDRRRAYPSIPLLASSSTADGDERSMGDFGDGRSMADFADGRAMADFADGRTMADFGRGSRMARFAKRGTKARVAAVAFAVAAVVIAISAVLASAGDDRTGVAADRASSREDAGNAASPSAEGDRSDSGVGDEGDGGEDSSPEDLTSATTAGSATTVRPSGSGTTTTVDRGTAMSATATGDLTFIALDLEQVPQVYVARRDGSDVRRLTSNTKGEFGPDLYEQVAWSSDGQTVFIVRRYMVAQGVHTHSMLFAVGRDGTNMRQVSAGDGSVYEQNVSGISVHRDGRIAFWRDGPGFTSGIWVMNADGSGERMVIGEDTINQHPAWTADGRIIFSRVDPNTGVGSLFTINADGSSLRKIADGPAYLAGVSPDGTRLVWGDNTNSPSKVFVSAIDGTRSSALNLDPATEAGYTVPVWNGAGSLVDTRGDTVRLIDPLTSEVTTLLDAQKAGVSYFQQVDIDA